MVHNNGDSVREYWKEGLIVKFKPKGLMGEPLIGKIKSHMYVNVLIIETPDERKWWVSTHRCELEFSIPIADFKPGLKVSIWGEYNEETKEHSYKHGNDIVDSEVYIKNGIPVVDLKNLGLPYTIKMLSRSIT